MDPGEESDILLDLIEEVDTEFEENCSQIEFTSVELCSGNKKLKDLICQQFEFDEAVFDRVIACGVDFESLLVLTNKDIDDMFPIQQIGIRAKFRHHLNLWRQNASTVESDICKEWVERHCSTLTSTSHEQHSSACTSPSTSTAIGSPRSSNFNKSELTQLLDKSQKGIDIVKFYEQNKSLSDNHRETLTSIIVDSFSDQKMKMKMEDIDYYFKRRGRGLNPIGKLHDKAVNARLKGRKFEKSLLKEQNSENDRSCSSISILNPLPTEVDTIVWLQHNNEPWADVEAKWAEVAHIRKFDITRPDEDILKKWPLFKHALGHLLVEIDYNISQPKNTSKLFNKWPLLVSTISVYFKQHIKDKPSIKLLQELDKDIDSSSRDCITFLLLHAVLKSPILSNPNKASGRKKWKPSIADSQEATILHCISVGQFNSKLEELKKRIFERGMSFQPIIAAIGPEKTALNSFYTFYDGIFYKFSSFLKCLDTTFKLFHVMNFKYPIEGKPVYSFLENYFYDFETPKSTNVTSLINFLNEDKETCL